MYRKQGKTGLGLMTLTFVSLFGQGLHADQNQGATFLPGEEISTGQLPGAYNESAEYKCDSGWDVFLTGNYIYWDWAQDGGMVTGLHSSSSITSPSGINMQLSEISPGYASGFQVGLGCKVSGMDNWNFYGEYTWYRNSGSKSNSGSVSLIDPPITTHSSVKGTASLRYDNADFLLARPFYFGKKLTANFYTGLKALWVTNKGSIGLTAPASLTLIDSDFVQADFTKFDVHGKLSSWALGPKFGMDSEWLIGYGFKILSNVALSAVYTRYTQTVEMDSEGELSLLAHSFGMDGNATFSVKNYGTIRPILETFLGLGWGSYFADNNYHFDLSVGYDFNMYWSYVTSFGGSMPAGNLCLHGLNVQARFDF